MSGLKEDHHRNQPVPTLRFLMSLQSRTTAESRQSATNVRPANENDNKGDHRSNGNGKVDSSRILGITATGPIYRAQRDFALIPEASAFALLQELSAKIDDPDAPVVSSLAGRVSGKDALQAWLNISTEIVVPLVYSTGEQRIAYLRRVLATIRRCGKVDGLETVLGSAINAAWPWMNKTSVDRVLNYSEHVLHKSKVALSNPVAIVDPSIRSVGLFAPGALSTINFENWRADFSLFQDQYISGVPGVGPRGDIFGGNGLEDSLSGLTGGSAKGGSYEDRADELLHGGDSDDAPGGLPSLGSLPGKQKGAKKTQSSSYEDRADELLHGGDSDDAPGGLPSLGSLPGKQKGAKKTKNSSYENEASNWMPHGDYSGIGLSNFIRKHGPRGIEGGGYAGATPGGPLAPTGQLGVGGGEQDWLDGVAYVASGVGLVAGAVAVAATAPVTIPIASAAGIALIVTGAAGGALVGIGAAKATGLDKPPEPKGDNPKPPDKPKDDSPKPPNKPKDKDLYPDPDGGGGGNPTQIWDNDGGGGTPNTIWDSDGGGGTPNTIWDSDGGGGTPNTISAQLVSIPSLAGPGLKATLVQVGPAVVHF